MQYSIENILVFISFYRLISMFVCFVAGETMRINCFCVMDVMTAIIRFVYFRHYLMCPKETGGVLNVLLRYKLNVIDPFKTKDRKQNKKLKIVIHACNVKIFSKAYPSLLFIIAEKSPGFFKELF